MAAGAVEKWFITKFSIVAAAYTSVDKPNRIPFEAASA